MARWLILAALVAVALLLLTHTSGVLDGGGGSEEATGDALEEALRAERAARAAAGEGAAPGLSSATAAKAKEAAQAAREHEAAAAGGETTGPYELRVIDAGTFAPLDAVELRDADGEVLGATDKQGRWRTEDAGVPSLSLHVQHPGYVTYLGAAVPGEPLEIALHPGIALEAVLVGEPGDKPIPGASVRAWDVDHGREVIATGTDAEGRFRLRAVRPHHPLVFVVSAPERAPFVKEVLFDASPVEPWLLRVAEGSVVQGRVFDAKGKPSEGAVVWLMPAERRPLDERIAKGRRSERRALQPRDLLVARTAVAVTDEEGRYAFRGLEAKRAWQPVAWAGPRHPVRGERVVFREDGATREVDIHLQASATLKVSVRDSAGRLLGHAELEILTDEGPVEIAPGDTWEQGVLTLEGLLPGRVAVRAELPGRPSAGGSTKIAPGRTERIDVEFDGTGSLQGRVRNRKGEPVWQALVVWRGHGNTGRRVEVRTDQDGRFRMQGLVAKQGRVTVSARDLPHTRTTYETFVEKSASADGQMMEILLEDGTKVEGRFPDLEPGTDLVCRMIAPGETSDWPLKLDAKGAFRRDGPDVRHAATFVFYLRGHPPLVVTDRAPFGSGEVRNLGSLGFEDTNPREGRVVGEDGRPLHGAKVSIAEFWSSRSTRTDDEGEFVLARLPDRGIRVRIDAEDYPPALFTLETGSQFRRQVFALRRGRRVAVQVLDPRRRPGAAAKVVAERRAVKGKKPDDASARYEATADAKGRATLWLPDGAWHIHAAVPRPPYARGTTPFDVAAPKNGKDLAVVVMVQPYVR